MKSGVRHPFATCGLILLCVCSVAVYHYDEETVSSRQTEARLSDNTLCMIAVQGEKSTYTHYDVHSLYGASQIQPTLRSPHSSMSLNTDVFSLCSLFYTANCLRTFSFS